MLNRIAGVDEAGRGAVIGPLVVAAVAIDASSVDRLIELGVKDSKMLDRRSRMILYSKILELCSTAVCIAEPRVIDAYVYEHALNVLEARMFAIALSKLKPLLAYVDACDTKPERFSAMIARMLDDEDIGMMISAAHKADRDNVLVGAASIVAKVTRDSVVDGVKRRYGDFGSGYPSDGRTRRFIRYLFTSGVAEDESGTSDSSRSKSHSNLISIDVSDIKLHHFHDDSMDDNGSSRFSFIRYSWKPIRSLLASI
ncbi:Ribonuclease HII [archaeon HR05]|nr:Ribonuclease HII [archaeon HR05]